MPRPGCGVYVRVSMCVCDVWCVYACTCDVCVWCVCASRGVCVCVSGCMCLDMCV